MKKAILAGKPQQIEGVYGHGRREALAAQTDLFPEVITVENFAQHREAIVESEVIFTTWGFSKELTELSLSLPHLKAVFYAAGSVRYFAQPLLDQGISVFSSWAANAVPVAQFSQAQILLALKGYFQNTLRRKDPKYRGTWFGKDKQGIFYQPVGLLGFGQIGQRVARHLRHFKIPVKVYAPFTSAEEALAEQVELSSMENLFRECRVVSNHLPNLPDTVGLITGDHLRSMPHDATFINTGRGATVNEAEMIQVLQQRPDLVALLDVTTHEPLPAESELYDLPNALVSTHIAGALGDERVRMADYALEEFTRWRDGKPLRYQVTTERLRTMA